MLVLGIDPGTAATGYGVVARDRGGLVRLVECGVVRTRARDPLPARLREVYEGVAELIARHRPDTMAVESVFYAKNVRTTVTLGHARGVILLAGELAGLDVHEFPPTEIKKAVVGTGVATKEQVQFMLTRLLRLKSVPSPSALTYCMAPPLPEPTAPRMPQPVVARPLGAPVSAAHVPRPNPFAREVVR